MGEDTKNYGNRYELEDFWINTVAPKYLDVGAINNYRVGMFGYINEIMGVTAEDSFNATSNLVLEMFPHKAKIPEMILSHAAMYNITDINAYPARMRLLIYVTEQSLLEATTSIDSASSEFIIDKDSVINVEGYTYLFDYNIKILVKRVNDNYIYTAQYIIDGQNPLSDIRHPYIRVIKMRIANSDYVFLDVVIRQLQSTTYTRSIYMQDIIETMSQRFTYEGMLSDFVVSYRAPRSDRFIQIDKLMDGAAPIETDFCYFNYPAEQTIEILFPIRMGYFRPESGSEIRIDIYTTNGAEANFNYRGESISVNLRSETIEYPTMLILGKSLSESSGGKDKLTDEEIKRYISTKVSTRNYLATETDIDAYFRQLGNMTRLISIKKRNDIDKRLFTLYSLMKNDHDNIIPTNTLNLRIEHNQFEQVESGNRQIIRAGTIFRYFSNSDSDITPVDRDLVSKYDTENDDFYFTSPFVVSINRSPHIVTLYLNSINREFLFDYSYINDISHIQFMLSYMKIKRNAVSGETGYEFELGLIPNGDLPFELFEEDPETGEWTNLDLLRIRVLVYNQTTAVGYFTFHFVDIVDDVYIFRQVLETDDFVSINNMIRITDGIKPLINLEEGNHLMIESQSLVLEICTFIKYPEGERHHNPNRPTYVSLRDNEPDIVDYTLTNIYRNTSDPIPLMENLSRYIQCFLRTTRHGDMNFLYFIKFLPVVKYTYLIEEENMMYLLNEINRIKTTMNDINQQLIELTSVDLKFFNTYGKSRYFTIGADKKDLDTINIRIRFKIRLSINSPEGTGNDILDYMKEFIENVNASDVSYVHVSDIITNVKNNFPNDIMTMEFVSINNFSSSDWAIESRYANVTEMGLKLKDYVPEFVNIDIVKTKDGSISGLLVDFF